MDSDGHTEVPLSAKSVVLNTNKLVNFTGRKSQSIIFKNETQHPTL